MKKILYLMHVDWNWIKQRPHFLAEKLANYFNILVIYQFFYNRKSLVKNPTNTKKISFIQLPFKKIELIKKTNISIIKAILNLIIKLFKPEIIWLTHPMFVSFLPEKNRNYHLVYDCMDDILEFNLSDKAKLELEHNEKELLKLAECIFVSSNNLKVKLIKRGCEEGKLTLVRNAFNGNILKTTEGVTKSNNKFTICYVGTISHWIDFEAILYCLKRNPYAEFHFIGPQEVEGPRHERIKFYGPIEHNKLYNYIKQYNCLIMPFKINKLIEGVDPVKLYEYINWNKNIITVYYDEISRFKDFVNFYNNKEELSNIIKKFAEEYLLKYSNEERERFLKQNSWEVRTKLIIEALQKADLGRKNGQGWDYTS